MITRQEDEQALERLVRAGRGDPDDAQLRRLEDRFDTWLAESAAPPSGRYAAATGLRRSVRYVPVLGAALLALGIGVFEIASNDDAPVMREGRRPSVASDRVTMVTEPSRSARLSTEEPVDLPAKQSAVPVDALPSVPAPPPRMPAPSKAEAPSSAEAPAPSVVGSPSSEPPAERAVVETTETEVSYLRRARNALQSDPARALSIADQHPSRFPRGALDQERELIAIDALVRLGRSAEARERADRFRARYPSSAHLGRVNALVGGSP